MNIDALAHAKFRVVEALVSVIAQHRLEREAAAFTNALIPQNGLEFETSADIALVFDENRYGYNEPYKGGTVFKKHLFQIIGDLKSSGEEFECAVHLERMPQIKSWVRNTSRQPHSFWLQTSSDKFYPDFVALLNDGRILVIEYKGEPYISNDDSKEKRLVGSLWSERSGGNCIFLMVEDSQLAQIDAAITRPQQWAERIKGRPPT
jgi:type III restriction enzyme